MNILDKVVEDIEGSLSDDQRDRLVEMSHTDMKGFIDWPEDVRTSAGLVFYLAHIMSHVLATIDQPLIAAACMKFFHENCHFTEIMEGMGASVDVVNDVTEEAADETVH